MKHRTDPWQKGALSQRSRAVLRTVSFLDQDDQEGLSGSDDVRVAFVFYTDRG